MKLAAVATAVLALAGAAHAAEPLSVEGSSSARFALQSHVERLKASGQAALDVVPVGTGLAMLHLIDGKSDAAVITMPLVEAVAAAREAAWGEGRLLRVPALAYHPIEGVEGAGLVTVAGR